MNLKLYDYYSKQIELAKRFESHVAQDDRFEVVGEVTMGLVCFRLKGNNEQNEKLLKSITDDKKVYMVPSKINGVYFLRFAVCARTTEEEHVDYAWSVVQNFAGQR